jgi:uncharacterized protein YecT (DUF1311 family)
MMKKVLIASMAAMFLGSSLFVSPAKALPDFKKAFEAKYVSSSNSDDLKEAFKTAGCNVCHVKDKDKKFRNAYGMALAKITGGHANADLKSASQNGGKEARDAKLKELLKTLDGAFEKVEAQKSASGQTYGEILKAGKLPQ